MTDEIDEGDDTGSAGSAVGTLTRQMKTLDRVTAQFGKSLSGALAKGITQGKGFEDILKTIGQRFIEIGLKAALKPLEGLFTGLLSGGAGGLSNLFGGLFGGGGGTSSVTPFASGGVISTPHFFPMGRGLGLAGERGAEAILPLARGPDGRLGVASNAGRGGPVSISMTVQTPDAESFRRSEAQVSASLARAVARGQRSL